MNRSEKHTLKIAVDMNAEYYRKTVLMAAEMTVLKAEKRVLEIKLEQLEETF